MTNLLDVLAHITNLTNTIHDPLHIDVEPNLYTLSHYADIEHILNSINTDLMLYLTQEFDKNCDLICWLERNLD